MEEQKQEKTAVTLCPQCAAPDCDHLQTSVAAQIASQAMSMAGSAQTESDEIYKQLGVSSKYEILGRLGEGGMSVVYKARHRVLNQLRAIKMLQGHLLRDDVQVRRFLQEAQALYKLDHANIVKVHDMDFTGEGQPYLVMDFLEGISLSEQIKRLYSLPVPRALTIFEQCCDAIAHAHANGVVHRDIKPSNILLVKDKDVNDVVKIVDFGIAKLAQEGEAAAPHLTQTGEVFGSPLYMSPEQCLGGKLDARSDIYSFGCVMYEALSGRPPLDAENALAIIHMHVNDIPEPLRIPNCSPGLCQMLDQIIFKCMHKDPKKRYQSMSEVKAAIHELAEATAHKGTTNTTTVYIRYSRWYQKLLKHMRKHPFRYCLALPLLVACLITLAVAALKVVSTICELSQTPQLIETASDWVWRPPAVLGDPPDFGDRFRKANLMLEEAVSRDGPNTNIVPRYASKMEQYLSEHGHWDEARKYAVQTYDWYVRNFGEKDPRTADAAFTCGECLFHLGLFHDACNYYEKANKFYSWYNSGLGGQLPWTCGLRIAYCNMKQNDFISALKLYQDADPNSENGSPDDKAMILSGRGDCRWAAAKKTAGANRELLLQARSDWQTALQCWKTLDQRSVAYAPNIAAVELKLADAEIALKNYEQAADYVDAVLKSKYASTITELPHFHRTYGRLLWHAHRFLEALKEASA